ncbi:MAG TPA: helix-turn-helix domain-containing protein [Sphingomonas sp.]|nr:helix-turn-helix domain-containing protein [Sphingomonas sp.]
MSREMARVGKSTTGDAVSPIALPVKEGRVAKRRRATRARLLEAAYQIMAEVGVDASKIKDITDRADVGFGTFYNYFETKDELANQVLDCVIDDYGRRNIIATRGLRRKDPALVMPVSMRLVMREMARTPMWQWWALRPDILVDRMRDGFGPFGKRDIRDAMERGIFHITEDDIDSAWALANWMMVGGIHDIVVGQRPLDSDMFVVHAIVRMMGVELEQARRISSTALPKYSAPHIDWTFELAEHRRQDSATERAPS